MARNLSHDLKRVIAGLCAVLVVAGAVPAEPVADFINTSIVASAEDSTETVIEVSNYTQLTNALTHSSPYSSYTAPYTVKLTADIDLDTQKNYTCYNGVTLDLNGKSLKLARSRFSINSFETFTIIDSSEGGNGAFIDNTPSGAVTKHRSSIYLSQYATLNIKSGIVVSDSVHPPIRAYIPNYKYVPDKDQSELENMTAYNCRINLYGNTYVSDIRIIPADEQNSFDYSTYKSMSTTDVIKAQRETVFNNIIHIEDGFEMVSGESVTAANGTTYNDLYYVKEAILNAEVTTAPTATNPTYTGEAQNLVTAGEAENGTMQYAIGENDTDEPTEYGETIPTGTNAGTYYVWYKAFGADGYEDSDAACVTVTIGQADNEFTTAPTAKTELVYDGTEQELLSQMPAARFGEVQYKVDNGDWSSDAPKATSAGSHTVYYKVEGTDDYTELSAQVSVSIGKAANSYIKRPSKLYGITYNGTSKQLSNFDNASAKFGTIQYKVDSGSYSTDMPTAITAGLHVIWYKVDGTNDYDGIAADFLYVSIDKATPNVTAPTDLTAAYGQTLADVTLPTADNGTWAWDNDSQDVGGVGNNTFKATFTPTDTANYNTVENVEVTVTVGKADPTVTAPTDLTATYGDTLKDVSLPDGWAWDDDTTTSVGDAGTNTFSATFTPDDEENYKTVTVDLTITVGKADPEYTAPTGITATYGQTLADVELPTGWTWDDSTQNVGDVGDNTFKATFTPSDDANYNTVENVEVTVTVGKADPSYTIPEDLTATYGQTLADVTLPTADNGTWSWQDAGTTSVGDAGSNTFKATFTPNDETNYNILTDINVTVTVEKADVTVTAPTAKTLTYTGNAQALINKGSATGGTMVYSLEESGEYTADIPTGTNAGDYTVYYKVVGDDNHNDSSVGSVNVSIAKADIVLSGNIAVGAVWLNGGSIDFGDGAYIEGTWSSNKGKYNLTGKHTLNYGGFYQGNHYWFTIDGNSKRSFNLSNDGKSSQPVYGVTINSGSGTNADPYKAVPLHTPCATVAVTAAKDLTYNGSAQALITEGTSSGGTIMYSLGTSDAPGTEWTTDISTLTGTDAGDYYVWFKVEADENHNDFEQICLTVTISQKSIETAVVTLDNYNFDASDTTCEPEVNFVILGREILTKGTDYTVSYKNNEGVSDKTPTVVIEGKGNYTGTCEVTFTIGTDLSGAAISVDGTFIYDGNEKKPAVTVTCNGSKVASDKYTVSYDNNINAGTATLTITGKSDKGYTGSASTTFTIAKASIASVTVDGEYAYTGEAVKPTTLTVKDSNGNEIDSGSYDVQFVNNTNAGTATVVVTATGDNYTGTAVGTFKIDHRYTEVPEASASCNETGVKAHYIDENYTTYLLVDDNYVTTPYSELVIEKTAHSYGEPEWIWSKTDDGYKAYAKFTCTSCGDTETLEATVTGETVTEGVLYTATVTDPNANTVTDTKLEKTSRFTVQVNGGGIDSADGETSAEYDVNSIAIIEAEPEKDGQYFAGWYVNGVLQSKSNRYSFFVSGNVTVVAGYTAAEQEPSSEAVVSSSCTRESNSADRDTITAVGDFTVDSRDYAICEAGFVVKKGTEADFDKDSENVHIFSDTEINYYTYKYTLELNVKNNATWTVRPYYVTYEWQNSDSETTIRYGEATIIAPNS